MPPPNEPDPTAETAALPPGDRPPGGTLPPGDGSGGGAPPPGGGPGRRGWRGFTRSRDNRVLGGVCAGVARELDVDPFVVRAATVALTLLAGLGLFLYIGALVLMPDEEGEALGSTDSAGGRLWTAVGIVALVAAAAVLLSGAVLGALGALVPLAAIAAAGLLVWWFVSGDGLAGDAGALARRAGLGVLVLAACAAVFVAGVWITGLGSGTVAAGLVIAAGVAVVAGAFFKPVRWAVPVAFSLALGTGVAAATDLDLHGGAGERIYRPASAADLRAGYQLGAGRLVVDLRQASLPRGDVPLRVRVGLGQALVIVPPTACVASKATVGAGAADVLGRASGGLDVDWQDAPAARPAQTRLVVDGDVGMGVFQVSYRDDAPRGRWGDRGSSRDPAARADRALAARACTAAVAPGA